MSIQEVYFSAISVDDLRKILGDTDVKVCGAHFSRVSDEGPALVFAIPNKAVHRPIKLKLLRCMRSLNT